MDSTLIAAPSSTKNQKKKRDPEAHSTKKGNQWHFGYNGHIGVDEESGVAAPFSFLLYMRCCLKTISELDDNTEKLIFN